MRVVVLHVPDDRGRAAELARHLSEVGAELHPGDGELHVGMLQSAMEGNACFVVCMSRAAAGDEGFEGVLEALIHHKIEGRNRVLVAKLDARARVPALLRHERHADCSASLEAGARELTRALREGAPAPEAGGALASYLGCLRARASTIPVQGIPGNIRIPLSLDDVFVPLRALAHRPVWGHLEPGAARGVDAACGDSVDVPLDQAFRQVRTQGMKGLVMLGEPGSGKTTLLKHFVLVLTDPRRGPATLGLPADTVPVLVTLRRIPRAPGGLLPAVEGAVEQPELGTGPGFARELLGRRNLLLLVDGLDEVPSSGAQVSVLRWIDSLVTDRPDVCVVLTSRYPAYKGDARLDGRFLELHIRALEEGEARRYVARWQHAVQRAIHPEHPDATVRAEADRMAGQLLGRVFSGEDRARSLRRLSENPLLLHILCLVHLQGGTLPDARVELYARCVEVLLQCWREAKELPLRIPASQALSLLRPMAWWLHQVEKRAEAPLDQVRVVLGNAAVEAGRLGIDVDELLAAVRDDSGLVVDVGRGLYGFLHLTFQEYLCATHVQCTFGVRPQVLDELAGHFGDDWWKEVLLLAGALEGPPVFEPLMAALVRSPRFTRHPGWLDDVLRDAGRRSPRPFLTALREGVADAGARYEALRAVKVLLAGEEPAAGDRTTLEELAAAETDSAARGLLAELLGLPGGTTGRVEGGEPAPGSESVNERDGSVLVYVPAGVYPIGDDRLERSRPAHRVTLPAFWIGKYPVTNAQYARFLADNPGAQGSGLLEDKRFGGQDQPVVNVSWDDASLYCAWAGLVLPTEAWWEAAARGPEGLPYPWGKDAPTAEHANFGIQVGSTSPVGAYPRGKGPFGTLDQAGNVWEWCRDTWKEDAYRGRQDGERDPECATGDDEARPLRGGSWYDPARYLVAAARHNLKVLERYRSFGFRVARPARPER